MGGSSKNRQKIVAGIRELANFGKYEIFSGEVKTVNESETTIDVDVDEGVTVFGVRLKCIIDNTDGMYIVPAVGSIVTFAQIDGGQDYQLIQASKIDKVLITIENSTLEITNTGFKFNGGNLNGLVKIAPLVNKLNAIENKVNALVLFSSTHVHAGVTSGSSSTGTPTPPVTGTLTPTQQADLENTKIKQ
jgi:hypothetical protein